MWTTIHMANGIKEAEGIKEILKNEGFMVKINYALNDGEDDLYEILAPEFEAEDLQQVLRELNIY